MGFGDGLPGQVHTTLIAQFCSQLLPCPLPGALGGSSCKAHRAERSGSKYCYFNHLVWGFCWCISTGDEHDFGLIVMATVAAVLVSPCERRPGQAPAYEPRTGSGTAGSSFILFISVCFRVICVLKPFLGETSLASSWEGGARARWGGQHHEGCPGRGKDEDEQQKLMT